MPKKLFEPGNPGGPGRPEGSKNKSYLDASHWLQRADEEVLKQEDPEKRLATIKWATELIMGKVQVLPGTPGDSVSNAATAYSLLNNLAPEPLPSPPPPSAVNGNGGQANGA